MLNTRHMNFYWESIKASKIIEQQQKMLVSRDNQIQALGLKAEEASTLKRLLVLRDEENRILKQQLNAHRRETDVAMGDLLQLDE